MPMRSSSSVFWDEGYIRLTQRPLNSLAFILVPLLIYQAYALAYGTQLLAPRDLGRLLRYFGATAGFLPPLLILVVLLAQHILSRYPWRVHPVALGGMVAESLFWVLPVLGLSYFTSPFLAAAPAISPFARAAVQGLGAAIYEEFIFRLAFIGLLLVLLMHVLELRKERSAVLAIVVTGALFSLYHLTGQQLSGKVAFPWAAFIFRMLAGVYLGGLYVCRGFGIAVGTHAVWNLWVAMLKS